MNAKFQIQKKSASRKQKSASTPFKPTPPSEDLTFGVQSSDFFRISEFGLRISADSPSLTQFNSEF
jgi:hypothetical protein